MLLSYRHPGTAKLWAFEILCGTLAATTLIAPRGGQVWLTALVIGTGAYVYFSSRTETAPNDAAVARRHSTRDLLTGLLGTRWAVPVFVFMGFAVISTLWSPVPLKALRASGSTLLLIGLAGFAATCIRMLRANELWFIARGFVVGTCVGMAYLAIEHVTGGALKAFAINTFAVSNVKASFNVLENGRVVRIDPVFLNRHTQSLGLLLWPLLAAAWLWIGNAGKLRLIVAAGLYVVACTLILISENESTKMALVCSSLALPVAMIARDRARQLLKASWLVAMLGVVFFVSLIPPKSPLAWGLQPSATDRIVIWMHTAARWRENPLLGVGANMTEQLNYAPRYRNLKIFAPRLSPHAHNMYLQVWFELGLVGALLLAWAGFATLSSIRRLALSVQPFAISFGGMVLAMVLSGPSLWQYWLISIVLLATVLVGLISHGAGSGDRAA